MPRSSAYGRSSGSTSTVSTTSSVSSTATSRSGSIFRHNQDSLVVFAACYITFVCTGVFPSPDADSTLKLASAIDRVMSATVSPSATLLVSLIYLERLRSTRASQARAASHDARAAWRTLQHAQEQVHPMFAPTSSPARRGGSVRYGADGRARGMKPASISTAADTITPAVSSRLHRIWSAAFILADCFMNDNAFTCQSWSIVTDYTPEDCVALKRCFLLCLDHDVWIRPGEYRAWSRMFRERVRAAAAAASSDPLAASSSAGRYFTREMDKGLERAVALAAAAAARIQDEIGPEPPVPRHSAEATAAVAPSRTDDTAAKAKADAAAAAPANPSSEPNSSPMTPSSQRSANARRTSAARPTSMLVPGKKAADTPAGGPSKRLAERFLSQPPVAPGSAVSLAVAAVVAAANLARRTSSTASSVATDGDETKQQRRPSFITTTSAGAEAAASASMRRRSSLLGPGSAAVTPSSTPLSAAKAAFMCPLPAPAAAAAVTPSSAAATTAAPHGTFINQHLQHVVQQQHYLGSLRRLSSSSSTVSMAAGGTAIAVRRAAVHPTAAAAITKWFEDLNYYEKTLEQMAHAKLDDSFRDELRAIEQWFSVLSDPERTTALYSLLQHITPIQVRFFITVLQQMAQKIPVGATAAAAGATSPFMAAQTLSGSDARRLFDRHSAPTGEETRRAPSVGRSGDSAAHRSPLSLPAALPSFLASHSTVTDNAIASADWSVVGGGGGGGPGGGAVGAATGAASPIVYPLSPPPSIVTNGLLPSTTSSAPGSAVLHHHQLHHHQFKSGGLGLGPDSLLLSQRSFSARARSPNPPAAPPMFLSPSLRPSAVLAASAAAAAAAAQAAAVAAAAATHHPADGWSHIQLPAAVAPPALDSLARSLATTSVGGGGGGGGAALTLRLPPAPTYAQSDYSDGGDDGANGAPDGADARLRAQQAGPHKEKGKIPDTVDLESLNGNFDGVDWRDMVRMSEDDLIARGVSAQGARRKLLKVFELVRAEA
ncbi:hypothetical protein HK405_004550, partial [Cladochytrium tenue]